LISFSQIAFFLQLRNDDEEDVLLWWYKRQLEFPCLAPVARRILSSCATSVASERLFSLSGSLVSAKRSCLKPDKVNMLTTLAFNSKE
jgi:hypothetical protein